MSAEMEEKERATLRVLVEARFAQSVSVPEVFFAQEAGRIAEACWAMARRFHSGGRLLAFGNGAGATDAQHVSVEFVHPVIVGKRALPASLPTGVSTPLARLARSWRSRAADVRYVERPFGSNLPVLPHC